MGLVCKNCGATAQSGFKFCNVCGTPIEPEIEITVSEPVQPYSDYMGIKGRALRILTGPRAGEFVKAWPECEIGREGTGLTLRDNTLSPHHSRLATTNDKTMLEDLDSLNGIFFKIKDKVVLKDNDLIRAGDHYFLYEVFSEEDVETEYGADFYASPSRSERFRLVEVLRGGRRGRASAAPDGGITVGRLEGDFTFPDDKKMSDRHFTIRWTQRGGILVDYSENGTFVQIHQAVQVEEGDIFFAGQTLLRVV